MSDKTAPVAKVPKTSGHPIWNFPVIRDLVLKTVERWGADRIPRLAASFSFFAILSLAPFLVLSVVGLAIFYGHRESSMHALLEGINQNFGRPVRDLVGDMIKGAMNSKAGTVAATFSIIVTFFSASNLFLQLDDAVNSIWAIELRGSFFRNLIVTRITAFIGVLIFGVAIALWLGLDTWLGLLVKEVPTFLGWGVVKFVGSMVYLTALFSISLRSLPKNRLTWSDVVPGAIVTGIGITITKYLLSLYFGAFNVSAAYGSAGALVVVLLWIYYTSQVYFFGVEMTFVFATKYGSQRGREESMIQHS